jgi:hypothetical protein
LELFCRLAGGAPPALPGLKARNTAGPSCLTSTKMADGQRQGLASIWITKEIP